MKHLINKNVDWNEYKNTFPIRYIARESKLDTELHKIISDIIEKRNFCKILDVGGGPEFTIALHRIINEWKFDCQGELYLLDPFVTMKETADFCRQIDWDYIKYNEDFGYKEKFDLIVMRGSMNYLTLPEINTISNVLNYDGILIANSFALPKNISREIETAYSKGKETCEIMTTPDGIRMFHRLEIILDGKTFEHEFYYHGPFEVVDAMENRVDISFYGSNSVLYKQTRKLNEKS